MFLREQYIHRETDYQNEETHITFKDFNVNNQVLKEFTFIKSLNMEQSIAALIQYAALKEWKRSCGRMVINEKKKFMFNIHFVDGQTQDMESMLTRLYAAYDKWGH